MYIGFQETAAATWFIIIKQLRALCGISVTLNIQCKGICDIGAIEALWMINNASDHSSIVSHVGGADEKICITITVTEFHSYHSSVRKFHRPSIRVCFIQYSVHLSLSIGSLNLPSNFNIWTVIDVNAIGLKVETCTPLKWDVCSDCRIPCWHLNIISDTAVVTTEIITRVYSL